MEKRSTEADMSLAFRYKVNASQSPIAAEDTDVLEYRDSRVLRVDPSSNQPQHIGANEIRSSTFDRSKSLAKRPLSTTRASNSFKRDRPSMYASLPDIYDGLVTHKSTTIIEKYKLRSESPASVSGISRDSHRQYLSKYSNGSLIFTCLYRMLHLC